MTEDKDLKNEAMMYIESVLDVPMPKHHSEILLSAANYLIQAIGKDGGRPDNFDEVVGKARALSEEAERMNIPFSYFCDESGVFNVGNVGDGMASESNRITYNKCFVRALTRNSESENWGMDVEFQDSDGNTKSCVISARLLHEDGCYGLAQILANDGLGIVPGKETDLALYLSEQSPDHHLIID